MTPTSRLFRIGDPVAARFDWGNAFVFDRATEACVHQPGRRAGT